MKTFLKRFFITLVSLTMLIVATSNYVHATEPAQANYDYSSAITSLYDKGSDANAVDVTKNVMGTLINTIKIIGTGVAVIMIIYVAIKYMSAAPAEKADFKKSATAFIVGAVVLFASTNILDIIYDFASNTTGTT